MGDADDVAERLRAVVQRWRAPPGSTSRGPSQLALAGVAIGIGAALGLTRLMTNLLFGVTAHDPLAFVAVASLLIPVALPAC